MNDRLIRRVGWIGLFILIFFSMIYLKVFFSSRAEFRTAEAALAKGNDREAIIHYERAILWYLPIGGYVEPSAEALWKLATALEEKDKKLALEAFRSLRSGFYAARSFYTPGKEWIARSDQKIASLMAQELPYSEADKKKTVEQRTEEALAILKRPLKPHTGWSIVLEIGFWGWVAGVLLFIMTGFNAENRVIPKRGLLLGGWIVFFYALWIVGMMNA
ncbi:MAG: hypothetical protein MPW14_05185 [Candidatus Manganitrophus sp.]|nr:hypothetical protein [Candidatus Manganitrophus sp.]WDT71510.1 MAG: hypothetical protein MPW17_01205 [Candidatus Manganitrophus sp.]WDT81146.1 MAG: hypothetical protein MPW14_05185 [Candidatus Manganitrophus sp.]